MPPATGALKSFSRGRFLGSAIAGVILITRNMAPGSRKNEGPVSGPPSSVPRYSRYFVSSRNSPPSMPAKVAATAPNKSAMNDQNEA